MQCRQKRMIVLGLTLAAFAITSSASSLNFLMKESATSTYRLPTLMQSGFKSPNLTYANHISQGAEVYEYGPENMTLIPSFLIAALGWSLLW